MGVWSSISFCNLDKKRINHNYSPSSRQSGVKQILCIDSNSFSTTVLQDVKEIRIQESYFENDLVEPHQNDKKEGSLNCSTYFEYSMGGNLKYYKEHLQQDFELERKLYPLKDPGQRLRNTSHSDNDSEPESLRYARKPQEIPVVNTIAEEPELSFDDYSTIYQPEFMLNINSQSLVKEMPKHLLEEKVNEQGISDKRRKEKNKITISSQDLIEDCSPAEKLENVEIHVVSKSIASPKVKRNNVFSAQNDVFDYHCSSIMAKKNSKPKENQKIISVEYKNQECLKNKRSTKSRRPQTIHEESSESNVKDVKNTPSKVKLSPQKCKKLIHNLTTAPLTTAESKNDSEDQANKPERREEFNNKNVTISNKTDIMASAENNPTRKKTKDDFFFRLNMDTATMFDNIDLFQELEVAKTETKLLSEREKKDAEFYPESPISELCFFKTPCSTRHNSLEIFEQLENECIEDSIKQETKKLPHSTTNILPTESFKKLPKEFQEIAKRLSKNDSPKKSSPSLHQVNFPPNFNCSSSTCSTISPRSPSGRTLFRTPSYKMPKTPSLSRQHPSTYVTQHTSSRSRPSSRVSSRAASPTREHIEALL